MQKIIQFYHQKEIVMLKLGCTRADKYLPDLEVYIQVILYQFHSDDQNEPFFQREK